MSVSSNTVNAVTRSRVGGGMRPSFVPRSADDSVSDEPMSAEPAD